MNFVRNRAYFYKTCSIYRLGKKLSNVDWKSPLSTQNLLIRRLQKSFSQHKIPTSFIEFLSVCDQTRLKALKTILLSLFSQKLFIFQTSNSNSNTKWKGNPKLSFKATLMKFPSRARDKIRIVTDTTKSQICAVQITQISLVCFYAFGGLFILNYFVLSRSFPAVKISSNLIKMNSNNKQENIPTSSCYFAVL